MSEQALKPSLLTDAQRELLAARLRKGRRAKPTAIQRRAPGAEVPLSFAQEQLWFLDRFAPGLPTYNIPHLVWLSGPLQLPALDRAVTALVGRHESLRTSLVTGAGGRPYQAIAAPAPVPLPVLELAGPAQVRDFAAEQAVLPFDLANGPLYRFHLLRLAETEHALVMVMQHSVFDGWSLGVLLTELAELYRAGVTGEPAGLAEPAIQFGDYAIWERQRLQDPAPELIEYWRDTLAGAQPLQLATDRPRPAQESFAGEVRWRNLGSELLDGLRELSRDQGGTLFGTLLGGLFTLLHRYTGQRDIVIGTPTANRGREELAGLIGFLINTLPIRVELADDPSFAQLLQQVRENLVSAQAHAELPFGKLVDALGVHRDAGRSPVFQVALTLAEQAEPAESAGVRFRVEKIDLPVAKFDLSCYAELRPDGLWLELAYASDLFDAATIERLFDHLGRLLAGAVADPDCPIGRLPMLSEQELIQELETFNHTAAEFDGGCLHELFGDQARRTPDAIAAVLGADRISYRDLNARANQLARRLRELGVGPEVLVGVSMRSSIDRLAALLAILKAGGGYLSLDPALPTQRLAFMLADTAAAVVLTDQASQDALPPTEAVLLAVDTDGFGRLADTDLDQLAGSTDTAYVIYTSGSTGQPKGVQVEHRNAVNFVHGQLAYWQIGTGDRVLQFSSLNFDASVLEIFAALSAGAMLVLTDADTRLSPPRLGALMRKHQVSFGVLPPAVLNLLADQDFPELRVLISVGEELRSDLALRWQRPGLRLGNGYGPTETTVLAAFTEVTADRLPPPIGRPPANYRCYVLDRRFQPVPVGVVGELLVGGAGVSRGYLNRPELTAQRFVPDPFSTDESARLYRTGDLVKRLPDGNIAFVGRIDGQVKLHGQRIELGEIESALAGLPGVRHAVVVAVEDQRGDRQLVGYAHHAAEQVLEPAELKRQLAQWLPGYMVPSQLVVLDSLPMNASGKVDKAALPRPGAAPVRGAAAPSTLVETMLVDIYATVLNLDEVGVDASFFEIGGSSLQAMRLISQIEDELGVDVGVAEIFLAPRPDELARLLCADHGLRDTELDSDALDVLTAGRDRSVR